MKPPPTEKSYHIFYQMMAGLHPDERAQLGLSHFGVKDLNYLNMGDTNTDELEDAERFEQWRNSLAVLGIPFMDVIRILSAILLLGNVRFTPRYVMVISEPHFTMGPNYLYEVASELMIFPVIFQVFKKKPLRIPIQNHSISTYSYCELISIQP